MHLRRLAPGFAHTFMICGWCSLALTGCSQEENLEPDPGASPFYPATADTKGASTRAGKTAQKGVVPSDEPTTKTTSTGSTSADSTTIDARFGTNDVERQLRVA